MNIPVILKTVTFLWSVNCSSHPSQPFMFNRFFFIVTFVVELLPLRLNAWLSYKRSDISFFAFIEKCDFVMCLFYNSAGVSSCMRFGLCSTMTWAIMNESWMCCITKYSLRYSVTCLQYIERLHAIIQSCLSLPCGLENLHALLPQTWLLK